MNKQSLPTLLEKYYEGITSPEEELILYLKLLDEPAESPYQKDLKVLEAMMVSAEGVPETKTLEKKATTLSFFSSPKRWAIAAILPLLLVIGTYLLFNPSLNEQSFRNSTPIAQEEVNQHANMAFELLNDCFESSSNEYYRASERLHEANGFIEASLEPFESSSAQNNFGWENLNYYE